MKVLIVCASRHGATRGLADRMADVLRAEGFECTVADPQEAPDPARFDAVIAGSAVYLGRWLKPAVAWVRRHQATLAARPTWLFSSGPLGTSLVDRDGGDVLADPGDAATLATALRSRGSRVFFGAFDPSAPPAAMAERLVRLMPAARSLLPAGDFRDWGAVEAWARQIAAELAALRTGPPGSPSPAPSGTPAGSR